MRFDRTVRTVAAFLALAGLASAAAASPPPDGWTSTEGQFGSLPAKTPFASVRPVTPDMVHHNHDITAQVAAYIDLNVPIEGDGPRECTFSADGSTVLVVNQDTDELTFIDANTRQVTGGVTVGDFPQDVAVSADGKYAVTANVFTNDVSIIDMATKTLIANVPIQGQQAFGVRITPDSKFAVVAVINNAIASQFTVVDLDNRNVSKIIPCTGQGARGGYGTPEFGISGVLYTKWALSPNGADIVLLNGTAPSVNIYSVASGTLAASIPVAASPGALDISADSSTVVVSHEGSARRISVIDLPSRTLTGSRTTSIDLDFAGFIRITPAKTHAMCSVLNAMIFADLATGATTSTISTGSVGDIEISFDGKYAFVSNFNSSVVNIATQTLAKTLTLAACTEAAVSPNSYRAVALNDRFREDAQFYNINGASSVVEGLTSTGAAPEIDCPKAVAVSPDGRSLVVANVLSRNASIINLGDGSVRATVNTGDRGLDVAITPDSSKAVIVNGDNDTVSIIDLNTDTLITNLAVSGRPGRVVIAPDGQYAYVLNVAGTDMIHKIQLFGTPADVGTQLAGQTGSILSYAFAEVSGITLSPNGAILAVCDSFNDRLVLIDTATMATIATPSVGDFPIRAIFNHAGTRAYVANSFSDDITVVGISGGSSAALASVPGIDTPLGLAVEADDSHVYAGAAGSIQPGVYSINTATNLVDKFVTVGGDFVRDMEFTPNCNVLIVGASNKTAGQADHLYRVRARGVSSAIIDSSDLTSNLPDIAYSRVRHAAVASMPIPDGVNIVRYTPTSDLTGDGDITLDDFFFFFNAWDISALEADMDGDGQVTLEDFFTFFNGFDAGCP